MATVALLRVKNESRWLHEALRSIRPCCDRLVVFDDHSEDETPQISRDEGADVLLSPFLGLQEARDKDYLLEHAKLESGDACLMIDGDEILHEEDAAKLEAEIERGPQALSLRVLYLWNEPSLVRVDGVYGRFRRPSVFRYRTGLSFKQTGNGGGFHCGNMPWQLWGACQPSQVRLLHMGYLHREDRIRKYHWYRKNDPNDAAEQGYVHMVQGDLPEVPATARLMHAGPLRLEALA